MLKTAFEGAGLHISEEKYEQTGGVEPFADLNDFPVDSGRLIDLYRVACDLAECKTQHSDEYRTI